jgi:hypothetical protein
MVLLWLCIRLWMILFWLCVFQLAVLWLCIRLLMVLFWLTTIWDMDVAYMNELLGKKKKAMECIILEKIKS